MNAAVLQRGNPKSSNDGYHFKSTCHYIWGFQEMLKMQRNGKLCDVVITVGLEVYRAHKLVFASASKYFSDLFDDADGKIEICIDEISPTAFRSILQFFYTGEILITVDNVEDLLFACRKFRINSLETACSASIPKLLNPTIWFKIKAIAGAHHTGGFYQKCHSYALEHFTDIAKTVQFLQLPFEEVKELIKDNELKVLSDEEVYSAVIKWVKYDLRNREPNLPELMKHVKLPLLDKTYFRNNVAKEHLMRDNFECTKLLLEATEYQSGVQCEPSPRIVPRKHYNVSNPRSDRDISTFEQRRVARVRSRARKNVAPPRDPAALPQSIFLLPSIAPVRQPVRKIRQSPNYHLNLGQDNDDYFDYCDYFDN